MSRELKDLAIIGAGGFAREVATIITDINKIEPTWNLIGLVGKDDHSRLTVEGFPVIENIKLLANLKKKPYIVIAIADTRKRKLLAKELETMGFEFATLIDPSVSILGNTVVVGKGSIICAQVALAINTKIGKHCILNTNCYVGHDTIVDDYVSIMPHTAFGGEVEIGEGCYFGINCTCINMVKLGVWSTFGAGCVIVQDMSEHITAVGVPAKIIKNHKQ